MKIDIGKMKRTGKTEEEFSFEFQPDPNLITLPNASFDGLSIVEGKIYLTDGADVFVEGEIKWTLTGECSRCLEKATATFDIPFKEDFTPDGKEGTYQYKTGIIDLTKAVEDNIIMNMPMKLLCREDCEGITY